MKKMKHILIVIIITLINSFNSNAQTPSKSEMIANRDLSNETLRANSTIEKNAIDYYKVQTFFKAHEKEVNAIIAFTDIKEKEANDIEFDKQVLNDVKILSHTDFIAKYDANTEDFELFVFILKIATTKIEQTIKLK